MTTTPLIDSAHITHGKVAAQMRVLETENRRLTNLLDSACAAAGMLPMEPGRYELLADKVANMRHELEPPEHWALAKERARSALSRFA